MNIENPLKKQKILLNKHNLDYFITDIEQELSIIDNVEHLRMQHNYLKYNSIIYCEWTSTENKTSITVKIAKIEYNQEHTAALFRTKKALKLKNNHIKGFKLNHTHLINNAFNRLAKKYK